MPTRPRQEPPESSRHRSIGWAVPNATMQLALEDLDLVAENQGLDVLLRCGALPRDDQPENAAKANIR